jgi:hypothetical protein
MWVAVVLVASCSVPPGSDHSEAGGEVGGGDDGSGNGGSGDGGSGDGSADDGDGGSGGDGKMDDGPTTDDSGDDTGGGDTGGTSKSMGLDGTWTGQLYIEVTDLGMPADCIDGGVTLHVTGGEVEGTGGCFVELFGGDDKVHLDLVGTVTGAFMSGTLHGSTSLDSFDTTWTADFPHSKINLWGVFEAKTTWFAYDGRFSLHHTDE